MSSVWLELREIPVNGTYISVLEPVTEPIVSSKVIKSVEYYESIYITTILCLLFIAQFILFITHANISDECRCSRGCLPDNHYSICADCFNNIDWNNSVKFIPEKVQRPTLYKNLNPKKIVISLKYKLNFLLILFFFFTDFHSIYCYCT